MATPQTLTTKQLQAGFKVGHMTIFNWRAGSAKRQALPCTTTDGRVTFKLSEVKAWARKHGLEFTEPTAEAEVTKPGPKPKASVPAKKVVAEKVRKPTAKEANRAALAAVKAPVKKVAPTMGLDKVRPTAEKPGKLARAVAAVDKKAIKKAAGKNAALAQATA